MAATIWLADWLAGWAFETAALANAITTISNTIMKPLRISFVISPPRASRRGSGWLLGDCLTCETPSIVMSRLIATLVPQFLARTAPMVLACDQAGKRWGILSTGLFQQRSYDRNHG